MNGLSRERTDPDTEIVIEIKQLVAEDRLEAALQKLESIEKYKQDALLLAQRLTHNSRVEHLGTITLQDARVERTRIAAAILECLKPEPLLRRAIQAVYRSWKSIIIALTASGILLFVSLPHPTWVIYARFDLDTRAFHSTGNMLLASGHYTDKSCSGSPKGVWFRPLQAEAQWQASDMGHWLCLLERDPSELTDVVAFASLPTAPETVYALTAHNGVLVSTDSGMTFTLHPAGPLPITSNHERDLLRVSGTKEDPIVWVAGSTMPGLYRTQNGQWQRLGGDACQELREMKVISLLITPRKILIGSSEQGLWMSDNDGKSCRRVFDSAKKYDFHGIWDVSKTDERFLIWVQDLHVDGTKEPSWHLLLLCPVPGSCVDGAEWRTDGKPIWTYSESIGDVLVKQDRQQNYEWYAVTELFARVYHGNLEGGKIEHLPRIYRCFPFCDPALALSSEGEMPYLLASGREFHFERAGWWRQFWP